MGGGLDVLMPAWEEGGSNVGQGGGQRHKWKTVIKLSVKLCNSEQFCINIL